MPSLTALPDGSVDRGTAAAAGVAAASAAAFGATAFYSKGLVRTSVEHMQPTLIPSFAIAAVLAAGPAVAATRPPMEAPLDEALRADRLGPTSSSRAFLVDPDRWAAARLLRDQLGPNEPTFVGSGRHDKVFVNDVSAYFIARRRPATRWHHYHPGLQTSESVQRERVAELEAKQPRLIWLDSTFDSVNEPNASAISSGVQRLDDDLHHRYVEIRRFGSIVIAERRPTAPAPAPCP